MNLKKIFIIIIIVCQYFLLNQGIAQAQFNFDVETGIISTGYNDVRIPGLGGTFISFSDELNSEANVFYRLKIGYKLGSRSEVLALYAPLILTYTGSVNRDIIFQGETYNANSRLKATYKFNSYRATYRYYFLKKNNIDIAAGLTVKIRDARIGIEGDLDRNSEKTDFGLVPLINVWVQWQPTEKVGFLLDGDALAAPQGRAEDVLLALTYKASDNFTIKTGYRILEGGADNDVVYTFSMFHYAVVGVIIKLE